MKFEEAKKILKKEGFYVEKATRPCAISKLFIEYEDPTVCEAMQAVNSAGYSICMEMSCFDERKARLKKEYEENTKAPGSSENRIKEDSGVNPALEESASRFNDALLDEQAKKIKRLGKEISRLNGIIHDKNEEIKRKTKGCCELAAENAGLKEDLRNTESLLHDTREANSRNLDTCFKNEDLIDELKKKLAEKTKLAKKYAKELSDSSLDLCKLEKQLEDKNAVLSDVAEELRLAKIREKNLAELGLKYIGENEKLKKELADKVAGKIDAQALKSAESALACKEKVIAGKDEVIADLGKELKAAKKELEEKTKLVKTVRKYSKAYCEYGIEAVKMIRKMAKVIVSEGPVSPKDFKEYRRLANGYRFNPQLPDFSEEEEKKLSPGRNTHPTEDNPEEIDIEKAVKIVRKAMKEGHTVTIDYND
jgi:chromosome segregation ATPase